MKRKAKSVTREVKLKAWLLNHSVIETAEQCPKCTRDAIYKALNAGRQIILLVKGDLVIDAYEYKDKIHVFGFKG
jgi:hypothetical protein